MNAASSATTYTLVQKNGVDIPHRGDDNFAADRMIFFSCVFRCRIRARIKTRVKHEPKKKEEESENNQRAERRECANLKKMKFCE